MIKTPHKREIEEIANLHLASLKDGVLYQLGKNILKIFYEEIIDDKYCFILAYYLNGKIVGIAASSEDSEKFLSKVKKSHFSELV